MCISAIRRPGVSKSQWGQGGGLLRDCEIFLLKALASMTTEAVWPCSGFMVLLCCDARCEARPPSVQHVTRQQSHKPLALRHNQQFGLFHTNQHYIQRSRYLLGLSAFTLLASSPKIGVVVCKDLCLPEVIKDNNVKTPTTDQWSFTDSLSIKAYWRRKLNTLYSSQYLSKKTTDLEQQPLFNYST